MRISSVIEKPIVTEKAVALANQGKCTFRVRLGASKKTIAAEVARLFKVDVREVKTSIVPGKPKRIGRTQRFTKTKKWKKAIVSLKEGQKIDLFEKAK